MTVAALGALGLGGAAIADAAGNATSSRTAASGATSSQTPAAGPQREPLSSDAAAKVKAAALAKVAGATVLRTEAGGPYPAPYHAHIRTSDRSARVVLVNASFEATTVHAERSRGGRGGGRHGGRGARETALTGDMKTRSRPRSAPGTPARRSSAPSPTATRARRTSRASRRAPARSSTSS